MFNAGDQRGEKLISYSLRTITPSPSRSTATAVRDGLYRNRRRLLSVSSGFLRPLDRGTFFQAPLLFLSLSVSEGYAKSLRCAIRKMTHR